MTRFQKVSTCHEGLIEVYTTQIDRLKTVNADLLVQMTVMESDTNVVKKSTFPLPVVSCYQLMK